MATIFDTIRKNVVDGDFERAAVMLGHVVNGNGEQLAPDIVDASRRLLRQSRIVAALPIATSLEARDAFRTELLDLLGQVEPAWIGPLPPIVPRAGKVVKPSKAAVVDRREAALKDSAIHSVSWLEQGLCAARAVCKVIAPMAIGTGFLLSNGRIVTNNHVLASPKDAGLARVVFNYQEDANGNTHRSKDYRLMSEDFATSEALDCSIAKVVDDPQDGLAQWGSLSVDPRIIAVDARLTVSIIQHPGGDLKKISLLGSVVAGAGKPPHIYYETSTDKGSSGGPVLDDSWKVVALHRAAGMYWKDIGRYVNNEGVRFSSIFEDQELASRLT